MLSEILSAVSNKKNEMKSDLMNMYNIYTNERDFAYNAAQDDFSKKLALYNIFQADKAYNENKAWREMTYKTALEREDNAVQRRVEDLKKAGLSPVLAAGSPASSSATGSVGSVGRSAPSPNFSHSSTHSLALTGAYHDFGQQLLDMEYTGQQIDNMKKQNKLLNAQIDETKARTKNQEIKNAVDEYNFGIDKKSYTRSDSSGGIAGFFYRALNNWLQSNAVEPVGNGIDVGINEGKKIIDKFKLDYSDLSNKAQNAKNNFRDHFPKIYIEDGSLVVEEPKKKWFNHKK